VTMMSEPVPTSTGELAALLPVELASIVQAYQRASKSDATLRA
jgi:hypothetical protein